MYFSLKCTKLKSLVLYNIDGRKVHSKITLRKYKSNHQLILVIEKYLED